MNRLADLLAEHPRMKNYRRPFLATVLERIAAVRSAVEQEFAWLLERQPRVLQLALNEAEAIAWQSAFPHLVFPLLATEKVHAVAAWHARQESIRRVEPVSAFAE